jgi:hypothetical protein
MNLNKIKQWVKNKVAQQELEEIKRLVKDKRELVNDLVDFRRSNQAAWATCDELEKQNEGKRIALTFITTLLIMSLVGNAIQYFA